MSKRESIKVSSEEMQKQFIIIEQVRKLNEIEGKKPLALIETLGCQQNENDTERLYGYLESMGYGICSDRENADLILFNTCAVRENAELRVFGNIGALKHLKAKDKNLIIGICGCMMQQEHIINHIKKKFPFVDMIFGTHTLYRFPQILQNAIIEKKTIIDVESIDGKIAENIPVKREGKYKAFVSIMYGCNNFCSYCIVPYVRGRERSREEKEIIKEIEMLSIEGFSEITLLGQNVNSYGNDLMLGISFAQLLKKISRIKGIKRIRFMTSHPKDISDELIDVLATRDNVCKQLHLPFQAGSNKILDKMNRKYTKEQYLNIIKKVKTKIPNITLSSDVIVGFPGETYEDFMETIDVVKKVEFDTLYTFIYSKRKGTPAEKMEDTISLKEKKEHFNILLSVQNEISKKINEGLKSKVLEVLVEGYSKTNENMLTGRTDGGKVVNFKGDETKIGKHCMVQITEAKTWSLFGKILD